MTTIIERAASSDQSDRERFSDILAVQRAAYLCDGAPTLAQRRSDLKRFKAAMLSQRTAHRGRDEHRDSATAPDTRPR